MIKRSERYFCAAAYRQLVLRTYGILMQNILQHYQTVAETLCSHYIRAGGLQAGFPPLVDKGKGTRCGEAVSDSVMNLKQCRLGAATHRTVIQFIGSLVEIVNIIILISNAQEQIALRGRTDALRAQQRSTCTAAGLGDKSGRIDQDTYQKK